MEREVRQAEGVGVFQSGTIMTATMSPVPIASNLMTVAPVISCN